MHSNKKMIHSNHTVEFDQYKGLKIYKCYKKRHNKYNFVNYISYSIYKQKIRFESIFYR